VILSLPYSGAVDVWSIGCIFGELLSMIKENCPDHRARAPLFPGESCGELSDDHLLNGTRQHRQRGREQLDLILNVIGSPDPEELSHLDRETQEYVFCSIVLPPSFFSLSLIHLLLPESNHHSLPPLNQSSIN
jgi:hypothetical protein